ncbi:MAG TPA: Rieske 2Fe-2S domain-containing protein [Xanthobacteraceae bacterium]|jgi:nitrite reductase/ring-hydroxylating ferredoxin subunit/DMSO/TMAO reductase YedYZ heme-binding membrane subunit|nr:Rieske 2Fe-2S domain-containing protein [Xanthobacteraceae bacterium]
MSVALRAVQWNRDKLVYDAILIVAVALYVAGYLAIAWRTDPPKTTSDAIDVWIRASGSCAFLMLTVILCIGPLARLDRRFLKLLYNRRHFGVLTFLIASFHFAWLLDWYVTLHALPNLAAELTRWGDYAKFIGFPFKALGIAALLILFLLASTSHDFWLMFLTPRVWKFLHMLLYVAYGLVVMHVALGHMQDERSPLVPIMLLGSFALVTSLHIVAGWRERKSDHPPATNGWLTVGAVASIPDKGARIVTAPGGERIAVFRDGDAIGAVTNLCAHQNGPLGEGRIIDGCITCPWHGYQYRLADGCAPPPFTEKLVTYRVRIAGGLVEVDPTPLAPGTPAAIIAS